MAASQRDSQDEGAPEVLPLVTAEVRSRVGGLVVGLGILAVVMVAAGVPAPVRAPVVLVAALLLPGFPLVARLRVDLPTLLAMDVVTSLALEAAGALVMVKSDLWHPQVLGLLLAVSGVGGTLVTLTHVRHDEARHLQ